MITSNEESYKKADFLYKMAWFVEILAVIVGLLIAVSTIQMLSGFEINGNKINNNDVLLSGLAFVMVAVVEITKIPFAYAFYKSKRILWKIIFGLSLAFLMIITFESAMNGFSRGFTIQKAPIEAKHNDIFNLQNLNVNIENEIIELTKTDRITINNNYSNQKNEIITKLDYIKSQKIFGEEKQLQNSIKSINEEISFLKKELKGKIENTRKVFTAQNSKLLTNLSSARNDYNNDIINYQKEEKNKINEEKKAAQSKIIQLERKIENYINDKKKRIIELEKDYFNKSDIEKTNKFYNNLISIEKDKIINFINVKNINIKDIQKDTGKKINKIRLKIDSSDSRVSQINQSNIQLKIDQVNNEFKREISELNNKKSKLESELIIIQKIKNNNKEERVKDLEKEMINLENKYQDELSLLEKKLLIISSKNQTISDNNKQIGDYKIKINLEGSTIPVYNFAIWAYSGTTVENQDDLNIKVKYISDLSTRQVDFIAALWFGSLAAIVAWTGVLLALASFVLKDDARTKNGRSLLKIVRGFRLILIKLYNLLKKNKQEKENNRNKNKGLRTVRRFLATLYLRNKKIKLKVVNKEIPVTVEKIVNKEVEVIKEVLVDKVIIKEIIKEVPVDKIVTKEIIKEVPVDKIVFKEVPKEIIKHEYIYVPLYTNDTSLLNTSGKQTKDFVNVSEN